MPLRFLFALLFPSEHGKQFHFRLGVLVSHCYCVRHAQPYLVSWVNACIMDRNVNGVYRIALLFLFLSLASLVCVCLYNNTSFIVPHAMVQELAQ